jgi:hypothetical protein
MKSSNHEEKRASSSAESREIADSRSSTLITRYYCIGTTRANSRSEGAAPDIRVGVYLSRVGTFVGLKQLACSQQVTGSIPIAGSGH